MAYYDRSLQPLNNHDWRIGKALILATILAVFAAVTFVAAPTTAAAQQDVPQPGPAEIVSEERIFAGDTSCDAALGGTLTLDQAAADLPVTVCVYATNIGQAVAAEVFVSSELLDGDGEWFYNVARGETVVLQRFVTALPDGAPDVQFERRVYEGDVTCPNALEPMPEPYYQSGSGRTTVCYTISNLGTAVAEQVLFSDADFDLADIAIGDLPPGAIFEYRHFIDVSVESFERDVRDYSWESEDLEEELERLVDVGVIDAGAYEQYFAITDLYLGAGEADFGLQVEKWTTLGIQDYEFVYRNNCFCFWPDEVAPPWRVRVIDGQVAEAVSVNGGDEVAGTTIDAMFSSIDESQSANPVRLTGSFEILYGYPTNWYVDQDRMIADEEFGQTVLSFDPLRECSGEYISSADPCLDPGEPLISIERLAYEGDVPCLDELQPLPDQWPLAGNGRTTLCFIISNVGTGLAEDVLLSDGPAGLVDVNVGNLAAGETIVYRHYIDDSYEFFSADLRDRVLEFDDLVLDLEELVEHEVITDAAYIEYFSVTDLDDLAGQDPAAEIEVDFGTQLAKWQTLGIDDYEFEYNIGCFCFWPDDQRPPWRVRVIDGVVVSAQSISGGGEGSGTTIDEIFAAIGNAEARTPLRLGARFDLLFGLPTSWSTEQSTYIADDNYGESVQSFTPLRDCGNGLYVPSEDACTEAQIVIDVLVYEGDVACETDQAPLPAGWQYGGNGRTTVCFTIQNVGATDAQDVVLSDDVYGLVGINIGDVPAGESVVYRHYVDVSSERFLADLRDTFLDSDDLERELETLIDRGVITDAAYNQYFSITDVYSLAGQAPDALIEVDPETQRAKWESLGIDDYEFTYSDTCFCFWPPELAPPWKVRVNNGRVVEAVSVEGGGSVEGITLLEMIARIEAARDGQPVQLDASYDLVYGYPTRWYADWNLYIADEEFGQVVTSFTPLPADSESGDARFIGDLSQPFFDNGFFDSDDLEREIEKLVTVGITPLNNYNAYLDITDVYSALSPGPDGVVEVDPDFQGLKFDTLSFDDYEFVYRDNCFCVWADDQVPPWRVRVEDGVVVSAESIFGGGQVGGITMYEIFDVVDAQRQGEFARLEVSYDMLYGYPTNSFIDRDSRVADDEFGRSVLSFTPLRECNGELQVIDAQCVSVDVQLYAGDIDCEAPAARPLPDDVILFSSQVTACVTAENLGLDPVRDFTVILSNYVNNPAIGSEQIVFDYLWREPITERVVIDRRIRNYQLEPEQPGNAQNIENLLNQLEDAGAITKQDRNQWYSVSDLNGPVPGESVLQTQVNKWSALGLDDYEFTYRQFCFCPPDIIQPTRVRVVGGVIVSPIDPFQRLTISEMFDQLDPDSGAFSIDATFDRLYGLPSRWAIDSIELAIDDEITAEVSDFVPLIDCNGELVDLGTPCEPSQPDCSDWGTRGPNWWSACWIEVLREWLRQLDRDWAIAWGIDPV